MPLPEDRRGLSVAGDTQDSMQPTCGSNLNRRGSTGTAENVTAEPKNPEIVIIHPDEGDASWEKQQLNEEGDSTLVAPEGYIGECSLTLVKPKSGSIDKSSRSSGSAKGKTVYARTSSAEMEWEDMVTPNNNDERKCERYYTPKAKIKVVHSPKKIPEIRLHKISPSKYKYKISAPKLKRTPDRHVVRHSPTKMGRLDSQGMEFKTSSKEDDAAEELYSDEIELERNDSLSAGIRKACGLIVRA